MKEKLERTGRWLRSLNRCPEPRVRVVCFPHAGGAASYFVPWVKAVPGDAELFAVRYPGREDRLADPFAESMEQLAEEITHASAPLFDRPVVFFGHSMGASVAYEVAARLAVRGRPPSLLGVSARHGPGSAHRARAVAHLDDDGLMAEVSALGGTPAQALAHRELRSLVLPAVRADYRLLDTYEPRVVTLPCPVAAYCGTEDRDVPEPAVGAWQAVTASGFALRAFPGGHFYLADHTRDLVADLLDRCPALL
ncbi:thioesterase II family protein [Streptomyces tibetensis]|uniref:thioesterase II family protein n=1 Tax=Streptomyces tibetensis TaxID=2382123 RepID=UPI0033F8632B